MKKNKEERKTESKELVPMKNLIDEEEMETEIGIETEKEINDVDVMMMIKADMIQAVTGKLFKCTLY